MGAEKPIPDLVLEAASNIGNVCKFFDGKVFLPFAVQAGRELDQRAQEQIGRFIDLCFLTLVDPRVDQWFANHSIVDLFDYENRPYHSLDYSHERSSIGLKRKPDQTPEVYLTVEASRSFCEHPAEDLSQIDAQKLQETLLTGTGMTLPVAKSFPEKGWELTNKQDNYPCKLERIKQHDELIELDKKFATAQRAGGKNWPATQVELNRQREAIFNRKLANDPRRTVIMTRPLTPQDITQRPFLIMPFIKGLNEGFVALAKMLAGDFNTVDSAERLKVVADGFQKACNILSEAIHA